MSEPAPADDRDRDREPPRDPRSAKATVGERVGVVARGALFVAALVFAVLAVRGQNRPLEEGQPAPPLPLVSFDGAAWDLSRFAGKPVVLNFWGTWCPPCLQEMPHFARAAKAYGDDVVFIGASVNSPREDVFHVIERFGIPYPIAQVDGKTSARWNARSLPSTYLLDAEHRVRWSGTGALNRSGLEGLVEEHLGVPPPAAKQR